MNNKKRQIFLPFFVIFRSLVLGFKGGAVGTLALSGIGFVSNYLDLGKRTVIFASAMMLTLSNAASDRLVCGIALFASAGIGGIVHILLTSFVGLRS